MVHLLAVCFSPKNAFGAQLFVLLRVFGGCGLVKEQKRKTNCLDCDGENAEGEDQCSKAPKLESEDASDAVGETHESAEPPAPKKPRKTRAVRAKNGEASSFARCPGSFPSKQRWEAIRSIFQKHLRQWLRDLGFTVSKYEALIC